MAQGLKIIRSKSRHFRCDISGCRSMTTLLITKRGDVAARPLHLCESCIRGLNALLDAEKEPETAVADEADTMDWGGIVPEPLPEEPKEAETPEPEPEPKPKRKPKGETKPNRAKGGKK